MLVGRWVVSYNSADEAGQYLTAYKQSEHRQPTLIRERVDKTPSALLRTALTSIPRVNKTDVETLRASFGVRLLPPLSSLLSPKVYNIHIHTKTGTDYKQSFAKMAQADTAQLARLPGFGPKKVARLKDAFERPFRTGTTSALAASSASSASTRQPPAPAEPGPSSTEQRAPSPPWDIELDLNSPSPPLSSAEAELPLARDTLAGAGPSSKRAREESPPWDIERGGVPLALDDEDEDSGPRAGARSGLEEDAGPDVDVDMNMDVDVDVDSDMDIALALRAKRRRA
jgi:DNA excision repair protein ERCC-1